MKRFIRSLLVLSLVGSALTLASDARAQVGPTVEDRCKDAGGSDRGCRGLYHLFRTAAAVCREDVAESPACDELDGNTLSEELVTAHEDSWIARALALQRGLDDEWPMQQEIWMHTHNSFNADAYHYPTLYGIDPNQIYSITDQLRMGIRAIEIDVHWAPSVHATPPEGNAVVVCHGEQVETPAGIFHFGCLPFDPAFKTRLHEVAQWLRAPANKDEVVLLYLENNLDDSPAAHDQAASVIDAELGDLLYRPPSAGCQDLPIDLSRAEIRRSGKRILLTGNCGPAGSPWNGVVFKRGSRWNESGVGFGDDDPHFLCAGRETFADYGNQFVRRYNDSTGLSNGANGGGDVTINDAKIQARCGVNLPGLDQLVPFDPRLEALVWSWSKEEPRMDGCAYQNDGGRFIAAPCAQSPKDEKKGTPQLPFACWDGTAWHVTRAKTWFFVGPAACADEGLGTFSVPHNGFDNELLRFVKSGDVWLNYSSVPGSGWTPNSTH